ncbi:hypothetical protein CI610_01966 [invertebrate metagenome]|uniref:PilC beta-propeller domain-containing protein n=1 Tax=invertebrate metagenome TaxID=1711999 RepID=A0A2H9T766_9ZZZZ
MGQFDFQLCRFFIRFFLFLCLGVSHTALCDYMSTPLIQSKIKQCLPLSDKAYIIEQVTSDSMPSLMVQTDLNISVHSSIQMNVTGNVTGWHINTSGGVLSDDLNAIWEANTQLALIEESLEQRAYGQRATEGRYIRTWLDYNNNKTIDDGEIIPFVADSFMGSTGYLKTDMSSVEALVNGIRSRKQLGSIAGGAVVVSGSPAEDFDQRFFDDSYARFRRHYKNRRHMVYVGSNDGMLHGINAGFWQEASNRYTTEGLNKEQGHPLGAEVWAWIPMNGLPHLSSGSETHSLETVLMDGRLQLFDVNIFPDDDDHPEGWGTILVAGMGFAAEPVSINVSGSSHTISSAYVVVDVTNPEKPPQLLAEITHPQLGFTTGTPVVLKQRRKSAENDWVLPVRNSWYLVLGSGPRGLDADVVRRVGSSDQNARLFIYDLVKHQFVQGLSPIVTQWEHGHIGEMVAYDNEQDYEDEMVLFGVTTQEKMNSASTFQGGVGALVVKDSIANAYSVPIMRLNDPVDGRLFLQKVDDGGWLYGGTGRLLTPDDLTSSREYSLWGIRWQTVLAQFYPAVNMESLIDVTDIIVFDDGSIGKKIEDDYASFVFEHKKILTKNELNLLVSEHQGWRYRLKTSDDHHYNEVFMEAENRVLSYIALRTRTSGKTCSDDVSSFYLKHFLNGLGLPVDATSATGTVSKVVSEQPAPEEEKLSPLVFSHAVDSLKTDKPVNFQQKNDTLTIFQGAFEYHLRMDQVDGKVYGRQSWSEILDIP